MTQQLQTIIDNAWDNRASLSPAAAPKEIQDAVEHVIAELNNGKLAEFTDIKKGFIVTQIDDQPVQDVDDFVNTLKNKSGKVMVEGLYPNKPMSYLYAFRM